MPKTTQVIRSGEIHRRTGLPLRTIQALFTAGRLPFVEIGCGRKRKHRGMTEAQFTEWIAGAKVEGNTLERSTL